MRDNPLQFAVVREDPRSIAKVLVDYPPHAKVLLIGSGGCQVLSLASMFPEVEFSILDMNPAQLAHVKNKIKALGAADCKAAFNIEDPSPAGLNQCGNFESLFRGLSGLIHDLVCPYDVLVAHFREGSIQDTCHELLFANKFWPVAFELYFSDAMLNTMFGPDATQHATPGSYPGYFRTRLELGLQRPDAPENYFLHHILLGHYIDTKACLPEYLQNPPEHPKIRYLQANLDAPDLDMAGFDLVDLSNIFDWMPDVTVRSVAQLVNASLSAGASLIFRKLNNERDLAGYFPDLVFDEQREQQILSADRSLFYNHIAIGTKHAKDR